MVALHHVMLHKIVMLECVLYWSWTIWGWIPNQSVLNLTELSNLVPESQENRKIQLKTRWIVLNLLPSFQYSVPALLSSPRLHVVTTSNWLYTFIIYCQHFSQLSREGLTMTIIHRLQVHIVSAKRCHSPAEGLLKAVSVPDWPTLMAQFWFLNYNQCWIMARVGAVGSHEAKS